MILMMSGRHDFRCYVCTHWHLVIRCTSWIVVIVCLRIMTLGNISLRQEFWWYFCTSWLFASCLHVSIIIWFIVTPAHDFGCQACISWLWNYICQLYIMTIGAQYLNNFSTLRFLAIMLFIITIIIDSLLYFIRFEDAHFIRTLF